MVRGREVFPAAARRRTQELMRGPARKSKVAARSSQGIRWRKVGCGVLSRMRAPMYPPTMPVISSRGRRRRASGGKALREATVLAAVPGKRAAVLVALAAMGAMPVKSRAGKEMKLPPPATALSRPAIRAAKKRRSECEKGTRENNTGGGWGKRQWLVASDWWLEKCSGADRRGRLYAGRWRSRRIWRRRKKKMPLLGAGCI